MSNMRLFSLKRNSILAASLLLFANAGLAKSCDTIDIPIDFDTFGLPHLTLNINNHQYATLFDLGSEHGIHLPKKLAARFNKLHYTGQTVNSVNIVGDTNVDKVFVIPQLTANCMNFEQVSGLELSPWSASIGQMSKEQIEQQKQQKEQPVIGRGFFKGKTITVDYTNKKIVVSNKSIKTQESAFSVPFTQEPEGITLELKTPHKTYRMSLDTGASISMLVPSKMSPNETVQACEMDFGPQFKCQKLNSPLKVGGKVSYESDVILFPIDPRFKMDGLLGADFFHAFAVEIDFDKGNLSLHKRL
jgi:hypothetical protein